MNSSVESATYRSLQLPYFESSNRYLERVRQLGFATLLDSHAQHTGGRFDIVTAGPVRQHAIALEQLQSHSQAQVDQRQAQLIEQIASDLESCTSDIPCPANIPFAAGVVLLFSYEAGRALQRAASAGQPTANPGDTQLASWPALHIAIYQWAIVVDHQQRSVQLVADPKLDHEQWEALQQRVRYAGEDADRTAGFEQLTPWQPQTSRASYQRQIATIKDYISAGDCYQVNLAQSFRARYRGDPWAAYQKLSAQCPMPYSAFVEGPGGAVISLSPERFLTVRGDKVSTRPIKGTRSRGHTHSEDQRLAQELAASTKDRAENLMIVDLLRNDLGRSCQTGSIAVPELFKLDSHANVHHLSSKITARLPGTGVRSALRVLLDCLPGGSITGAPKIRAMDIIEELEPCIRRIYCGNLVYLTAQGNMDSSILIRSLLLERDGEDSQRGAIHCWGGGGIVADSGWEDEYQESIDKVAIMLDALARTLRQTAGAGSATAISHLAD